MTKKTKAPIVKRTPGKKTGANFDNLRPLPHPHPAAVLFGLVTDPDLRPAPDKPDALLAFQVTPEMQAGGLPPMQAGGLPPMQAGGLPPERFAGVHQSEVVEGSQRLVEVQPSTKTTLVEVQPSTRTPVVEVHQNDAREPRGPSTARKEDRHIKDRVKWSGRFKPDLWQRITEFCYKHGQMEKLHFFELAAAHYLDVVEGHQTAVVEGQTPHDDLKIYNTREDIINTYKELTGNRWKPSDDRVASPFNRADSRFVELGMLSTFLHFRGKKINSFSYFKPEIEFMIEEMREARLSNELIEGVLRRRREQAKEKLGR